MLNIFLVVSLSYLFTFFGGSLAAVCRLKYQDYRWFGSRWWVLFITPSPPPPDLFFTFFFAPLLLTLSSKNVQEVTSYAVGYFFFIRAYFL